MSNDKPISQQMSEYIRQIIEEDPAEDDDAITNFVIDNVNILRKIQVHNREIKYILQQYLDNFKYAAPETMKYYFTPIICRCIVLELNNIHPSEWVNQIIELHTYNAI